MQLVIMDASRLQALVAARLPEWSKERFESAFTEYRRFLTLCKTYPDAKVMAPADVDEVWHLHMLDSVNYTNDCNRIFGAYLHHDPCIGEADYYNTQETLELYKNLFQEEPDIEWKKMLTCAGPGKGCGSIRSLSAVTH